MRSGTLAVSMLSYCSLDKTPPGKHDLCVAGPISCGRHPSPSPPCTDPTQFRPEPASRLGSQKAADAAANGIAEVTPKLKSVLAPKESPAKRGRATKAAAASPEDPVPPVASPRAPRSSRAKAKA